MKKIICLLMLSLGVIGNTYAQTTVPKDSTNVLRNQLKPYASVITPKALTKKGLFTTHEVNGKFYFEIPKALLGKDLLLVSRISKSASESSLYSGDEISNMVINFELANERRLLIRKKLSSVYAGDSTSTMYQSVKRSNLMPILESFPIEALSPESNAIVIDVTNFISGDNEGFTLNPLVKHQANISGFDKEKTFVHTPLAFPNNVEIVAEKTFLQRKLVPVGVTPVYIPGTVTFELNTSIVALPEQPMDTRFSDPRIGYFAMRQTDYDSNPNGVNVRSFIKRWRIEPKRADKERYLKGELVEPENPIVFYIDPATPKKWVPYLIQGVNDWQVAFEQAGFTNAIVAKQAPNVAEDPTWSLYDARHSAIVYKPSTIENASGPSIADPRTGEILESHINWYHNVMQLIKEWYTIQCGINDPRAQKPVLSDELMGQLIRFVASHEVGHTLGLTHNFGSSSTVPVEKLRDKKWVEENGFCPSIMDYARFNYVAQPEDGITGIGLLPRIGVYDKWAIEWGYKWLPQYTDADSLKFYLSDLISERTKDHRLWYSNAYDPRALNEDLGDDVIKANTYGVANLKRTIKQLPAWTKARTEGYQDLNDMYKVLQKQFVTYCLHVVSQIGGVTETIKTTDEPGPIYQPYDITKQKQAVNFLDKNLFQTPHWIADTTILTRTGETAMGVIGKLQFDVFNALFSS